MRPTKLRFLDALTAALEEITPANGYAHDLSGAVFRGRLNYSSSDPLPMVSILERRPDDADPESSPVGSAQSMSVWPLLIQGWVLDDQEHPTDPAYLLSADVNRRLAISRREGALSLQPFGISAVQDVRIVRTLVRPPDEVSSNAYFWTELRVVLTENHENPFL